MYECVIQLTLPTQPNAPIDRYALHQYVARMLSQGQHKQPRDYLYAVQQDGEASHVYVRSKNPRQGLGAWRPMRLPEAGRTYRVLGEVRFDVSPSRSGHRPDRARLEAGRAAGHYRVLNEEMAREKVRDRLGAVGDIIECNAYLGEPQMMSKPGCSSISMIPIHVDATVRIQDAQAAARIIELGLRHGRGFGFGALNFVEVA